MKGNVSFALLLVLCFSCAGLPLLEAGALQQGGPVNKAHCERSEQQLKVRAVLHS
jgi:hypothetical protein